MGETVTVTGMVLNSMPVGDYDKRLVILTRERGRISAFARGARRQNSPFMAGSRPFAFGEFILYEGRSSYTVSSMQISNYFMELSNDYIGACYGFYFLEFAEYYTRENVDESQMIKLLYQSLRAVLNPHIENELVRRIFELKTMTINGEYPQMFGCVACGQEKAPAFFSVRRSGGICRDCRLSVPDAVPLSEAAIYTMQFIITSSIEKLYTFTVSSQVLSELSNCMKAYIFTYIDRKLKASAILDSINSQKFV